MHPQRVAVDLIGQDDRVDDAQGILQLWGHIEPLPVLGEHLVERRASGLVDPCATVDIRLALRVAGSRVRVVAGRDNRHLEQVGHRATVPVPVAQVVLGRHGLVPGDPPQTCREAVQLAMDPLDAQPTVVVIVVANDDVAATEVLGPAVLEDGAAGHPDHDTLLAVAPEHLHHGDAVPLALGQIHRRGPVLPNQRVQSPQPGTHCRQPTYLLAGHVKPQVDQRAVMIADRYRPPVSIPDDACRLQRVDR